MDRLQTSSSDLAELVHGAGWAALRDVRDRIPWSLEVLDGSLTPLLSDWGGDDAHGGLVRSRVRGLGIDRTAPSLRAAAIECMRALESAFVRVGPVTTSCNPIRGGRRAAGVVLVGTETDTGDPLVERARISRLGSWIARSIEADLTSPPTGDPSRSELHWLASLLKILKRVPAAGSDRQVVISVIEALSVWHDVEAWGYRRTLRGSYALEAWLPGSSRADASLQLDRDVVASFEVPVSHAGTGVVRVGLGRPRSMRVVPVRSASGPEWCLVLAGADNVGLDATLAVYCDLLAQALDNAAAMEALRLTWAVVEHLLPEHGVHTFETAARPAIDEISRATRSDAWLTVSAGDTGRSFAVESAQRPPQEMNIEPQEVSVTLDVGPFCTAAVGLRRWNGSDFTLREMNLLRAAGATLSPWLKAATSRLSVANERRVVSRSFDQLIERQARNAAIRHDDVSVIVIALGEQAREPDVAQEWIGEIRRQIRPTDLAGRLTSGDIGILLLETPPRRAHFVADRVQQLIASAHGLSGLQQAGVGVAGWSSTRPAGSVVQEASARAVADTDNG